jgi:tetratricopeptide (TPR) repeat protein
MTANLRAALAAVAVVVMGGGMARASAPTQEHPGRALFERAEANFKRGQFEEARADYQAAYDVEPLPAFLFNIGQCHRNLGDYERARFFFQQFTRLDPGSPNRAPAEGLIVEMSRLIEAQRPPPTAVPVLAPSAPSTLAAAPTDAHARPMLQQTSTTPTGSSPFYRRPWFWAGVGGAILLGVGVAFALSNDDPRGTLPPIDLR